MLSVCYLGCVCRGGECQATNERPSDRLTMTMTTTAHGEMRRNKCDLCEFSNITKVRVTLGTTHTQTRTHSRHIQCCVRSPATRTTSADDADDVDAWITIKSHGAAKIVPTHVLCIRHSCGSSETNAKAKQKRKTKNVKSDRVPKGTRSCARRWHYIFENIACTHSVDNRCHDECGVERSL